MKIHLSFILATLVGLSSVKAWAKPPSFDTVHGTEKGLFTLDPQWSAGAQFGNFGASSLVVQRLGVKGGAVNMGLGLAWGSVNVHADYLVFLKDGFSLRQLTPNTSYNNIRGELVPYFGGGLQVGRGFLVRAPVGVQYTMVKDPVDFYGGLVLLLGRFLSDDDRDVHLWFNIGVRALL